MLANKINHHIQNEQQSFENFIRNLKQQRSQRKKHQYPNNNNLMKDANHKHIHDFGNSLAIDNNVEILDWKSLYLSRNRSTQIKDNKYGGDQTLKLKGKIGVANRSTIKQFELPSQYFTPTKSKLQHHLKNSRWIPNIELLPNMKTDHTSKKYLFSQDQMQMLSESKVLRGQTNTTKLSQVNSLIVLKYCHIHQLTASSDMKRILIFFVRLLQILGYSLPEPVIQKYKDCVYFGGGIKKKQIGQGLLYFYAGSLYVGELLEYSMHGKGIQIFFHVPAIFKGDFKQGTMHGYFEVTKDNEKYSGMVENGVYHGHGRLITRNGIVQGQFKQGKIVSASKNVKKAGIVKNNNNFRIRESLDRNSVEQYIVKSKLFDNFSINVPSIIKKEDESKTISQKDKKSSSKQLTSNIKSEYLLQSGYSQRNQVLQQGTQQYYLESFRLSQINPEVIVSKSQKKQRMNGHLTKFIQTIRQETQLGQQQPVEFKN